MKYGLAWVDPVSNQFVRWSLMGFSDSPEDWAIMQKINREYDARQSPENPECLLSVIMGIGPDNEPIELDRDV